MCVSQYLNQFDLNVQHQSRKIHFISNALLKLLDDMGNKNKKDITDTFNDIEFYHIILIKLTNNFKKHLQNTYKKDTQWKQILDIIKSTNCSLNTANEDIVKWLTKLCFTYQNSLIYYINNVNSCECLYISICFKKKIFKLIYDQQHHSEFHRTYDCILTFLFLHCFIKCSKIYIQHCLKCQLN